MADYEDTKVNNLVINNMSQEKFDELKAAGELDPTQVYCTPKVNALTEPYRLGAATSSSGYYMQLTPLENSNVALDIMRSDGTKAYTAWELTTNSSAKLFAKSATGLVDAELYACKYRNSNLTCTIPNWTYVSGQTAYLSFQATKMPAASSSLTGIAATYIGDTDETFTKGHTYMVESDGAETPTYTWKDVYEGGGASLPDQTDNAGKFLTTDGTTASWSNSLEVSVDSIFPNVHIGSISTGYCRIAIGKNVSGASFGAVSANVAIGNNSGATSSYTTAIGDFAIAKVERAIQIGQGTNEDANTFKVGNANGNFEIMSADGTIPTDRYTTTPTDAGTYVPKLTIAEDGTATREWGAESGGSGGASGDCLPLSGGTMTGEIGFDSGFKIYYSDTDEGLIVGNYASKILFKESLYGAVIPLGSFMDLGAVDKAWDRVCTTKLHCGLGGANLTVPKLGGTLARIEDINNIVEVLPTADNGYTTVKNFGNGYVEITGYASIGTVGAGTGSEVQIDLPAGYTMADANYWVNIAPTSETTMFDFKAEAKARSTTHFMVAYKNEDETTGLTAAGVYWEVRGMLATTEA